MDIVNLIGQILFGGYFVLQGFNHFRNSKMLSEYAASGKVPSPTLAVFGTGLLLLLGGLGVLFAGVIPGAYTQVALVLLVIFLVPVTFIMHQFWNRTEPMAKMMDMVNFMKNLALLGAVLLMM